MNMLLKSDFKKSLYIQTMTCLKHKQQQQQQKQNNIFSKSLGDSHCAQSSGQNAMGMKIQPKHKV
jgi:hypothetical protein